LVDDVLHVWVYVDCFPKGRVCFLFLSHSAVDHAQVYVCVVAAWVKLQFFHRGYYFFVFALSEGFFCLIEQTVDAVKV